MVDERRVTVIGLVGGALGIHRRRARAASFITAYLLVSLFGLTVFLWLFGRMLRELHVHIDIDIYLTKDFR